ncbi:MAG TPA: GNAT family N-acetyltransferase [Nonomuraea sp.]|nr:GNAT family N-acetyltransferase [Nonomuraea sp.]
MTSHADGPDVTVERDPRRFLAEAGPYLAGHRTTCSMVITTTHLWLAGEPPAADRLAFQVRAADGTIAGVAVTAGAAGMVLSPMPAEAATALEAALSGLGARISTVTGPARPARLVAERHGARTGREPGPGRRFRMYAVDSLPPRDTPGSPRRAGAADLPLLGAWLSTFYADADRERAAARADHLVHHGHGLLWEVAGEPVAFCGCVGPLLGVLHAGPVYTHPGHRGAGYGDAVWRAAHGIWRALGADLITHWINLDYPPTNAMLTNAGGRPLDEVHEYVLPARPG